MNGWRVLLEDDRELPVLCGHLLQIPQPAPEPEPADACRECLIEGTVWIELRTCLECGHTGCCESSTRRHATGHFTQTAHPIAMSLGSGPAWAWCYADQVPLAPTTQ
jgi:uncharacterized UBP type Zn finger protein